VKIIFHLEEDYPETNLIDVIKIKLHFGAFILIIFNHISIYFKGIQFSLTGDV